MVESTLTQRLLERYFLYSLAGWLVFLVVTLTLYWRGALISLIAVTGIVPLVILLLGAYSLRQLLWPHSEIGSQLRAMVDPSAGPAVALGPIQESSPEATGWNALLARVERQRSLEQIEARLGASMLHVGDRQLHGMLNILSDGMAVVDEDGKISFANRAFAALSGKPIDDLLTRSIRDVMSDVSDETALDWDAILQMPVGQMFEIRSSIGHGGTVLRITRTPLRREGGNSSRIVWMIRDVTQQKLSEEMRVKFLQTATHELRTPLTNIKAYAEMLALGDQIEVAQQKEFCNTINSEVSRLARFVDDLLNLTKMEAGALTLSSHETDLARLFEEVAEHVQPQMRSRNIEFKKLVPAKLPKLKIDKDKIEAALVNLLGNAAKYTPEGGKVRFKVESTPHEIQFHVEDTGIGIAEEEQKKVFEKFFRSGDPRVRDIIGTGLGLAFTQEVARMHGGNVFVHSELNKGTKFTMTLPIGVAELQHV